MILKFLTSVLFLDEKVFEEIEGLKKAI